MTSPLLATKLFAPPPSPSSLTRARLTQRLDAGLQGKLTLVCAPAGFGKSTLLGAWVQACEHPSAWLSLDAGERDPNQFVAYLTASLRSISAELGEGALALAQARPRPAPEVVLTHLINRLAQRRGKLVLVLDDYQLACCPEVDAALAFLFAKLPASLHVVIATREQPAIGLARLRAQGQVLEIGPDDLRFQAEEAGEFLNRAMALGLAEPQVLALHARTEGWPAGLQMAAVSLAGHSDADRFIQAFSGSHRLVQDYLLEEVLQRQPEAVQAFLLRTSVLERMCPALCDALMQAELGQEMLAYLERANLFLVPLDEERRWFRYHHLFGAMLQQRLRQTQAAATLHARASVWYEAQGLVGPALRHAVAAGDTLRAIEVVQGQGMPLYFLEDAEPVLAWLQDQPPAVLNAHPPLWLMLAWAYLATSQHSRMRAPIIGAELAIKAAMESAPKDATKDATKDSTKDSTKDATEEAPSHPDHPAYPALQTWRGEWHAVRAWEAVAACDPATIEREARLALALLPPEQVAVRITAQCALGVVHQFRGEREAAQCVYGEVLPLAQACGNRMFTIVASIALGHLQEDDNHLHLAARTYARALEALGDQPHLVACEVHLGLARIHYQWNELAAAAQHAETSSRLATLLECDSGLGADALRAQLLLARAEPEAALALLSQASLAAQTRNQQGGRLAIAEVQVQALLHTGEVIAAGQVAQSQALPLAHAWVLLARGQALQACECLSAHLAQAGSSAADTLRALLLKALALDAIGPADAALLALEEAMALAEPQGCVRAFIDLGGPMQRLLEKALHGPRPRYVALLLQALQEQLASFQLASQALARQQKARQQQASAAAAAANSAAAAERPSAPSGLAEPLSARELQILILICKGLSNQEIGRQIFLSLSTVKWHNQNIFDKLDVQRRTEAVARARELNLF